MGAKSAQSVRFRNCTRGLEETDELPVADSSAPQRILCQPRLSKSEYCECGGGVEHVKNMLD